MDGSHLPMLDEASYLGGSPRHPLPTTSIDHADLLTPMRVLDLSDVDDELDDVEDVFVGGDAFVGEENRKEVIHDDGGNDDNNNANSVGVVVAAAASEAAAPPLSPLKQQQLPLQKPVEDQHQQAPSPAVKLTKKKPAGKIVPSRYMVEASAKAQLSKSKAPAHPQPAATDKPSTPKKTTPKPIASKPPAPRQILKSASRSATPSSVTGEGSMNASNNNNNNKSTNSMKKATPRTPLRSATPVMTGSGGFETPKSSVSQPPDDISEYDLYLVTMIQQRTAKIMAAEINEKREAYLSRATDILTKGVVAISKLVLKNHTTQSRLFQAQCDLEVVSLASMTLEILEPLTNKIQPLMVELDEMEEALRIKGNLLPVSHSMSFPMTDDVEGQAKTAKKIIKSLQTQISYFLKMSDALPANIGQETRKLAKLLSDFDGSVRITFGQLTQCCKHLKKCLDVLVAHVYKIKFQVK